MEKQKIIGNGEDFIYEYNLASMNVCAKYLILDYTQSKIFKLVHQAWGQLYIHICGNIKNGA